MPTTAFNWREHLTEREPRADSDGLPCDLAAVRVVDLRPDDDQGGDERTACETDGRVREQLWSWCSF